MATSNTYENATQCKTCRCGEGDTNIWTTRTSDNPDKQIQKCPNCQVLKSGPLFLSSKGIGWTSWKKRWFILTRTLLVFYRSDPNATPQKGSEANLTLGGIDLNNSGSVVVKADKKLLTVLFPDGRHGRTFTLKAETSDDLCEWKTALENALAQAPSPVLAMGQNGIFRNDPIDSVEASFEQWRDRPPVKSLVVGRPILLALEDIDGSPSFLEKALRFIEEHGIKVEGILRQSADVEEVERRVREYEQGKNEFSSVEDAHVVCDCIKHVLRELPSSPVPATCCTALVEAYRTDRGSRINAMRAAIAETFPEPNRLLVQRILKMMRTVASHKSVNRMSLSALAACMAPLLLRPLLAGDCELEDDFNIGGDGSIQLLQAAAAANHAQAIVIILLEEYERIFDEDLLQEGSLSSDLYSESEDGDVEDEESTDNDILDDDGYHDPDNGVEADIEDDPGYSSSGTLSESNSDVDSDLYDNKASDDQNSDSSSPIDNEGVEVTKTLSNTRQTPVLQQTSTDIPLPQHASVQKDGISHNENSNSLVGFSHESISDVHTSKSPTLKLVSHTLPSSIAKCTDKSNEPLPSIKRPTVWGRTSARKNLSVESIDFSSEDEIAIQRLEIRKSDLQTKIAKEVKGNAILQESLEKRKETLHERRLALEQDIERLREQLQKETDLRACLEAGLMNLRPGQLPITSSMHSKTRADLEEIALAEADIDNLKQKVSDLSGQLCYQLQHSYASLCESCSQHLYARHQSAEMEQQKDVNSTTLVHQNANSSKNEDLSSGVAVENVQARKQDLPSPNREPSLKWRLTSETQNNTISSGLNGSQSTELSTIVTISPPKKFFANNEKASFRANHEDMKMQITDSPNRQHLPKQHLDTTNQNNMVSLGSSSASYAEEPSTVVCNAAPKKSALRFENSMLGAECENVKTQTQDSPSSPDNQTPQKLLPNTTNQSSTKYLGSNSVSSIEPTSFGRDTSSKKSSPRDETVKKEHAFQNSKIFMGYSGDSCADDPTTVAHEAASRDENSMPGAGCENAKIQSQDLASSPVRQSPQKSQSKTTNQSSNSLGTNSILSIEEPATFGRNTAAASEKSSFMGETVKRERAFQNNMISLGSTSASYAEELTIVGHDAASKKSASKDEKTDYENVKTQTQDPPSSPDKQPPQKLPPNTTNLSSIKSLGPNSVSSIGEPAIYLCSTASKKSSFWGETVKKETQDPQSLPNRQLSQKQQPNLHGMKSLGYSSLSSSEETTTAGHHAASRKPSMKGEEAASSTSSALTKLTNRLNFLKERRVQLVNELQNMDARPTLGPEDPPPKTNS